VGCWINTRAAPRQVGHQTISHISVLSMKRRLAKRMEYRVNRRFKCLGVGALCAPASRRSVGRWLDRCSLARREHSFTAIYTGYSTSLHRALRSDVDDALYRTASVFTRHRPRTANRSERQTDTETGHDVGDDKLLKYSTPIKQRSKCKRMMLKPDINARACKRKQT